MTDRPLNILWEDNHLLVINKPAGLPTMGAVKGRPTLVSLAKEYLKRKYAKPGNVYLGVVSRLDSVVTGVVVLARTSKAAARLSEQFRLSKVEKQYWAVVAGHPTPASNTLKNWLIKDDQAHRMRVVDCRQPGAKLAELSYCKLRSLDGDTLIGVRLQTGRKHQIRVQFAHHGHPILGDRKYGSRAAFSAGIALHARSLGLQHPVQKTWIEVVAPVPPAWRRLGVVEPNRRSASE